MRLSKAILIVCTAGLLALASCGSEGSQANECVTPGDVALFETCTDGDDCESCLCFSFNMGDTICTQACERDTDCPAPSPGCNGKGVCKRPGG